MGHMTRVGIAKLKANLSRYLKKARRGETVVVLDRNEPIAEIGPVSKEPVKLQITPPAPGAPRPCDFEFTLPPMDPGIDAVAMLIEDRRKERF